MVRIVGKLFFLGTPHLYVSIQYSELELHTHNIFFVRFYFKYIEIFVLLHQMTSYW